MLEYLESDEETSCCYIADGAESQQREFLGQMLSRRVNGLVELRALDLSLLKGKTAEAQAQAFHSSLEDMAALMERAGLADPRAAQLLRRFLPSCTMNDRASTARRAARLILGVNPDDIEGNDPTCAEHALVNILEAGRMGMDAVLRKMMDISDEQAETDAAKIKAMRTCVGWFSSPACALIYQVYALSPAHIVRTPTLTVILSCVQVAKYVALCSTKGYAIGQKFLEWMEARLADAGDAQILLGHSEDLLAICGSRSYVFFIDAAVTERLISQEGSLLTYLQEEADLGADGGGKLRASILTGETHLPLTHIAQHAHHNTGSLCARAVLCVGASSDPCMAAVRAMAIIADAVLWRLLHAVKPSAEKHVLDVLPQLWPQALEFFESAALSPAAVVEGSLTLAVGLEGQPSQRIEASTPGQARRSERARQDMVRICAKAAGNKLVEQLLQAAFSEMATAARSHCSEWLPGGRLCAGSITLELRARYDALVSTSTCVERVHALGRDADQRGKWQRPDTRAGIVLGKVDHMDRHAASLGLEELQRRLNICRPAASAERKRTLKAMLIEQGRAKRAEREEKLQGARAKRAARAAELERLKAIALATKYSELKAMSNTDLSDQLRAHKV